MPIDLPPNLAEWRWIVVNSSGGKDSQVALGVVVSECLRQGISLDRVVVSHQCLGRMEWPGTLDLVRRQAAFYGLRVLVSQYRNKHGEELNLLDYVRARGKWPDNKNRFCTSEFKRGPGRRIVVKLFKEDPGPVLNVFGFRHEESPARSKKQHLVPNPRYSSGKRKAWDWAPILTWSEKEVWDYIRASGVPYHPAYDLGMPRLSCIFCVFAPFHALKIAGRANPELLDEYCDLEAEIGHTFQNGRSISEVRDSILTDGLDDPVLVSDWEPWTM